MKKYLPIAIFLVILLSCTGGTEKKLSYEETQEIERRTDSIVRAKMAGVKNPAEHTLGIWQVDHYIDEFGDKTGDAFLLGRVEGEFSNSATTNSYLVVNILVDSENEIHIMLNEYGSSLVTSGTEDGYRIRVKDASENVTDLKARNNSDRLAFISKAEAKKFSDLLKKGGKLSVAITEITDYYSSTYRFTIADTKGYEEGLKRLSN